MPEVTGAWSLRRRLTTAVVALAAVLTAIVAGAVIVLLSVRSQQRTVIDRYFDAVSLTNERFTEQVDAETAIRGYALTDVPLTLQPLRQLVSPSYPAQVPRLRVLLHGDAVALNSFTAWDDATNTWYQQWARPTVAEIHAHGARSITTADVLTGKSLFDANRSRYAAFSQLLVQKRNATSDSLRFRTTLLFAAIVILIVGVATAGGLTWWGLRRWVLGPLTLLSAETRTVRSGALDHELVVPGPAEIQELASDVEAMRLGIVTQLVTVEHARQEIEASRRLVEAQAADLIRSNRDLEQFAYVASHDLQEPLRKVASFCQLLESRYAGQLDERADQYIAFAVDGAKRMQQLINDLLAFSRVGRSDQALVNVDTQKCFDIAVDNLAMAIAAAGATVTADRLPGVVGDAGLLVQLFANLIGNAIKFRGEEPPRVQLTVRDADTQWEFACSDNGLGVEPRYADRIFVIFQRLHGKEEYAGTGIGLALCKRIVEHHAGQIWLDTDVASGAVFRWTLPKQGVGSA